MNDSRLPSTRTPKIAYKLKSCFGLLFLRRHSLIFAIRSHNACQSCHADGGRGSKIPPSLQLQHNCFYTIVAPKIDEAGHRLRHKDRTKTLGHQSKGSGNRQRDEWKLEPPKISTTLSSTGLG